MMAISTPIAVAVVVTANQGNASLGPSLWFLMMMVGLIPLFAWLFSEECIVSKNGTRNGFITYALSGVILLAVIVSIFPGARAPEKPPITEACQQTIDRYAASNIRSQQLIHEYLKCQPNAGVGWMVWMFAGFVLIATIGMAIMDKRSHDQLDLDKTGS